MDNPIEQFLSWWQQAKAQPNLKQCSAVCISTIDEQGFPSGRFVDLKAVSDAGFTFCTHLGSQKGQDLRRDPKVAMTAWWDALGYQVRVKGLATEISRADALRYWQSRSHDAQLTTLACQQSQPMSSLSDVTNELCTLSAEYQSQAVPLPDDWGGFVVHPLSIEFLTFKESRLHVRELYQHENNAWSKTLLQP
ncbi:MULTISPECIES: pyridoxal 5'-phosphate synthase [Pseudoalteromonas]|uniref:pyridoxine/pyridoxamine 5'-phosphate oxidase n=1 Tax=Pseudoalteromonas TaxID=53246 RepID=UPI001EF4B762|nr:MULTISPECIES: pyridoxal 5'-phosphate synthase [Pseudoalteromonas]MCG7561411.1 pyridoxal 5'-phosphate synthase [Pseudoalteromonas sp. McH1-42]MEC4087996.1 pyridoxal 5'-phosphate synthase [Pseudoalteromonas rubra]